MPTVRISAAASRLGVSTDYLRELDRRGLFETSRDPSGHRRFSEEDLDGLSQLLRQKPNKGA